MSLILMPLWSKYGFFFILNTSSLICCNNLLHYCIFILSYFLPGSDMQTSLQNFYNWVDTVANEVSLPCHCRTQRFCHVDLKGTFHYLSPAEADKFVRVLSGKLMHWATKCTTDGTSAGSVIRATCSGKGQLSVEAILIGPFQDWLY